MSQKGGTKISELGWGKIKMGNQIFKNPREGPTPLQTMQAETLILSFKCKNGQVLQIFGRIRQFGHIKYDFLKEYYTNCFHTKIGRFIVVFGRYKPKSSKLTIFEKMKKF